MNRSQGVDPAIALLRKKAPQEEIDYGFVMECLQGYFNPRVKLNHLLKIGALIRVKKGIYIFGRDWARRLYSFEVLANMIYGPSYVSLEWACQYYGLIPEKVTTVTSVTPKRGKEFQTPVGLFSYDHLSLKAYSPGMSLDLGASGNDFRDARIFAQIATKEKALVDLLMIRRGKFASKKHFQETLFEDLRVEESDVAKLDLNLLKTIYEAYPHSATKYLIQCRELL